MLRCKRCKSTTNTRTWSCKCSISWIKCGIHFNMTKRPPNATTTISYPPHGKRKRQVRLSSFDIKPLVKRSRNVSESSRCSMHILSQSAKTTMHHDVNIASSFTHPNVCTHNVVPPHRRAFLRPGSILAQRFPHLVRSTP